MSATRLGDDFVLIPDSDGAWILRSDGTAVAKVEVIRHSGYTVNGYEACAPKA
ncbi:hypothetical protein [Nocardioides pantholopis]|uniref:hypothetical protein n=1 Tax=Nocardioides pantholopis TaxID=2483798 RepID=UPI0013E2BBCC|nr:hypothetical protein [Nocardioides pantholopis]